ncbi:MAG: DnaJ domain-containing protein, partial [Bacteroidota bacterium]
MNYFEFYELPVSFDLDAERLRKIFYANSRKYHPDFYTQDSAEAQAEALERSTLNNEAYKTLSNADLRMRYVLQLYAALPE